MRWILGLGQHSRMLDTYRKIWRLLSSRERKQGLLLFVLMIILGVIEMAGVASIFPLIAVLSNPELIDSNRWLKLTYETLNFSSNNAFFIFLSMMLFAVIVLRTLFAAVTGYGLLRYAQMRSHGLSVRLLNSYLRRPYASFLNRHSADMTKTVLSEVEQVINGGLVPALQLVSQVIIASFIISVLVIVEPMVALIALVCIAGAYGLIYYSIRSYLRTKGQERVKANHERFRLAQEVLSGVKEVKVRGMESGYLRRFDKASLRFARLRAQLKLIKEVPRHLLELVAIGTMLAVILFLLFRSNGDLGQALPVIALYAFAGLRLLPAIQVLYQSIVALRFGGPALEKLHSDLLEADHATNIKIVEPLGLDQEIVLKHVRFVYPEANRTALDNITLTIPARSIVGFIGPSGAGKSTLIDILLGLLEPQSGQLIVDGIPITRVNVRSWQRSVGYVPQHIFLADESIASNIALGLPPKSIDMAAVERAAKLANLHDFISTELPMGYQTEVGDRGIRLSGGQRQRVGIARALYGNPKILILDEATSALDYDTERQVMTEVNNLSEDITILMVAHRLTTLGNCHTIFRLNNGVIEDSEAGNVQGVSSILNGDM